MHSDSKVELHITNINDRVALCQYIDPYYLTLLYNVSYKWGNEK